jgi:hypothetical protein
MNAPLVSVFAASDGDGCIRTWRRSVIECIYKTLPFLRAVGEKRSNARHAGTNNVTCKYEPETDDVLVTLCHNYILNVLVHLT